MTKRQDDPRYDNEILGNPRKRMIQKKKALNGVASAVDIRSLDEYETRRIPEGRGSRRGNNKWSV